MFFLLVKIINKRNRYENFEVLRRTLVLPNGALGYWIIEKGA